MRPWWQVATPHRDIREGRFDEAVFAAKLDEVLDERGPVEYRDPETFFRQTYLTHGLHKLVQTVARRLAGERAEGIIQLQTPFGAARPTLSSYYITSSSTETALSNCKPFAAY